MISSFITMTLCARFNVTVVDPGFVRPLLHTIQFVCRGNDGIATGCRLEIPTATAGIPLVVWILLNQGAVAIVSFMSFRTICHSNIRAKHKR